MNLTQSNIAVIDFYHIDVPTAFLKVLLPVCHKIIFISNDFIISDLMEALSDDKGHVAYFSLLDDSIKSRDEILNILHNEEVNLCIFSTIEQHFISFAQIFDSFKGIKIPVIHNANFWFKKKRKLKIFREPRNPDHVAKLKMIKQSSALIVLDENIKNFIRRKYHYKKKTICFSIAIATHPVEDYHMAEKLKIVIPGNIEDKRRDYNLVLDAIERIPTSRVELILAGCPRGAYGANIFSRVEKLRAAGYSINTFDHYLTLSEFNQQLKDASLIIAPIKTKTSFAGIPEEYGISKISGSVNDILRYYKVGILPSMFPLSKNLKNRFLLYKNLDELVELIFNLLEEDRLKNEIERVRNNKYWAIESIRSRFAEDLKAL